MKVAILRSNFGGKPLDTIQFKSQNVRGGIKLDCFSLSEGNTKFDKKISNDIKNELFRIQPHKVPAIKNVNYDVSVWVGATFDAFRERFISLLLDSLNENDISIFQSHPGAFVNSTQSFNNSESIFAAKNNAKMHTVLDKWWKEALTTDRVGNNSVSEQFLLNLFHENQVQYNLVDFEIVKNFYNRI